MRNEPTKDNESDDGKISGLYSKYESLRLTYLTRAREAALLTIPTLVPPQTNSAATKYPTPHQSLGARGVNNLASKLLLALLPPNAPFFKLAISDFELEKLTKQRGMRGKVEEAFGQIERSVMTEVETGAIRVKFIEALKQLIVAGNVLLFVTPDGQVRVFPLSRYVVKRDPMGNVLEIIVKEDISPLAIPHKIKTECKIDVDEKNPENVYHLYTHISRKPDRYEIRQELNGEEVIGSDGHYPVNECPWMALRWTSIENEDYGRGFIEEYMGDLRALEGLSKALLEASAAASKVLFMLKPNSTTNKRKLVAAPNGSIIEGNVDDVGVLQLEKYADFRVALEQIQDLTKRLSYSFMLNTSVQRTGERVTAEEIRYMAGELEESLGGIYSLLTQEFQLPLVRILITQQEKKGKLPALPKDLVKPMVTTGMEALGRGNDLNKLNTFLQQLAPLGPEVINQYMNIDDYIARVGTSLGIDIKGLVKTQEEQQAAMAQQQMMQAAQAAAPHVAKGMMDQQAAPQ